MMRATSGVQSSMKPSVSREARVSVDGKGFRLGIGKFFVKGVTYGPFHPNRSGEPFPEPDEAERDFVLLDRLGANVLRVYHVPPRWFLDQAAGRGLRLLIDVPWNKLACFLEEPGLRREARETVRKAALACAGHPAVFALSVVNEIPADIVRWSGQRAIERFIDELIDEIKAVDAETLCTFGNFPTTEFLSPDGADFLCFNVYLHQPKAWESYASRLQMLAESRPLVIGEIGVDTIREGVEAQARMLKWQVEAAFRGGMAGVVVFSFTDDWFKDGVTVADWAFGLTRSDREPKPAFEAVRGQFQKAPHFPLSHYPKVSVVVASYNGAPTLRACLGSLQKLNYPDYEVLLVDDGSSDETARIATEFPNVRYLPHAENRGLSAARNTGIAEARGEVIAFTDADCRADEDWLYFVVGDLLRSDFVGMGGHNFLPPDDSWVAAAVMVSPGGPAHVMLSDREAEHVPGCNMVFYRWALLEVGGFDAIFRKAGDDVDICWRLQQRGYRIGFSPAGFVWHYRRSTVGEYLKQQRGYGEAEALLVHRHPEYFNAIGGHLWRGRIYSPARLSAWFRPARIYHGLFGTGLFQAIYRPEPSGFLLLFTSIEYHTLVSLPLIVIAFPLPVLVPVALANLVLVGALCVAAGLQAEISRSRRRIWSRPLVAMLYFLQPVVRGWARYRGRLEAQQMPSGAVENFETMSRGQTESGLVELCYLASNDFDRTWFLGRFLKRLDAEGWQHRTDTGWNDFDVEVMGDRWSRLRLTTVMESRTGNLRVLRCRLEQLWTLTSRMAMSGAIGACLIILGILGRKWPWLWTLTAILPVLGWWLRQQQLRLRRIFAVFLDKATEAEGLVRLEKAVRPGGER